MVAVCQLRVAPGRPDLNAAAMLAQIEAAAGRGADVVVFPELAVPGYFVGDLLEDESFVRDVLAANEQVREATSRLTRSIPTATRRSRAWRRTSRGC